MTRTANADTCRLIIAEQGSLRLGLIDALTQAGFPVKASRMDMAVLGNLDLSETDTLVEINERLPAVANLFPDAVHLLAWKTLICVDDLNDLPTLVLIRKEGQEPCQVQAANQEVVNMLRETLPRSPLPERAAMAPQDTISERSLAPPPIQDSLTRLVGEVAHDLNNLVTVIRSNCQLLFHEPILPKTAQALIQEIHRVGEQATLLTSHLTAAFQNEEIPSQVQDIHGPLKNTAGMLRGLLEDRHELILRLDQRPCPVRLVPGQLERVLINLAATARDAMPTGGTLTITTTLLDIDAPMSLSCNLISGPCVLITVTDTGAGLDENARKRLFQPLPSAKAGGQGLGLAIVAKLIRQHGGSIEVHSQSGAGTSFRIFLPRVPSMEDPAMKPTPSPSPGPETILLVEDEAMVRSIIRRVLQDNGFLVLEAAGGPEALLLAQQFSHPIHLLISDLSMPEMYGMEVAKRLAAIHPEARVLFLSGYNDGMLPGEKRPDKAIPFLQKPFKAEELLQVVREVLYSPA